jgi:hypothetical protein
MSMVKNRPVPLLYHKIKTNFCHINVSHLDPRQEIRAYGKIQDKNFFCNKKIPPAAGENNALIVNCSEEQTKWS